MTENIHRNRYSVQSKNEWESSFSLGSYTEGSKRFTTYIDLTQIEQR